LRKVYQFSSRGIGKGLVFIVIVLLGFLGLTVWKVTRRSGPVITMRTQPKGIGQSTPVEIDIRDAKHSIKSVAMVLHQGNRSFDVALAGGPTPGAETRSWKFWARGESLAAYNGRVGRREIPELQEGRATLRISATNDSWGNFFRGGRSEIVLDLPVRFTPPQIQVLSFPHYVNQGGSELVVFRVSPGTAESGVKVGDQFFPSWPVKESTPEIRLCLFAYAWNVDPSTPAHIVARDDAGNETISNFTYRVFPKRFRSDKIQLTDDFMSRVVPPIMSQAQNLQDQGSLLKNFLLVNGQLRHANAREMVAFSQKTAAHFLWKEPFVQIGSSKVEAGFADDRTYVYHGEAVDHQTHLGFDLAVVEHTPVVAANDGVVVHAAFFGIYGNTVIIDHGCGLQTLYAHLSSMDVKAGDEVKRGQTIGRTGQTGLAGGDHLHFTTLLNGIPVNPVGWWDPHWIQDRIEKKLVAYR
jgi:hypothetical protein